MKTINISVALEKSFPTKIQIGRQGENWATKVIFDCSVYAESFGAGTAYLFHQRAPDTCPYPVAIEQDGNTITWDVSASDTEFAGQGQCELRWHVDEVIAKTQVWSTTVTEALAGTESEEVPEAAQSWVNQVLAAISEVGKVAKTENCFEVSEDWTAKFNGQVVLGQDTVGGDSNPIYLNEGVPTACAGTVGGGNKPVYWDAGTVTECNPPSITKKSATVTPAAGSWTNVCNTGALSAGTYLLIGETRIQGGSNSMTARLNDGSDELAASRSSVYASLSSIYYSTKSVAAVTITETTFYLEVYLATSISCAGYLTAMKLFG